MQYNTIPSQTSIALLRSLGMLVQQASMYGMSHNVTALAISEAFAQLESALAMYGIIEMTDAENTFLVNGVPIDSKDPAVHNFINRLQTHKFDGVVFASETSEEEFLVFTKFISSSATSLIQLGGLKNALESAGLHYISSTTSAYKKVSETTPATPLSPLVKSIPASESKSISPRQQGSAVLDLSEALTNEDAPGIFANATLGSPHEIELEALKQKRRENAYKMASLLRATAALIENESVLPAELGQQQILASIERILKMVEASSRETRAQIAKLAGQVNADRQTIASIESAARRRGIGFNLTRKELLDQYAEINQEMLQPVTVSSGALDLLLSGKGGSMTTSQIELVKLAFDGMQRVNQLIEFTNRISGLPVSYTPDKDLIHTSYSSTSE